MKLNILLLPLLFISLSYAEVVYVETNMDTDSDGKKDLIYVSINRSNITKKLSSKLTISPYNLRGGNPAMHNTDVDLLPQDEVANLLQKSIFYKELTSKGLIEPETDKSVVFAKLTADSIGTGRSTGCPSVGDMTEALGAKAVIDWLNGRAIAYDSAGNKVKADWANGRVGMIGTSYNGTLPTMVATTGVEGLKAIVPVAAISNWYDYYRANGLVVGPGGYVGEDADILGKFIVRKNACAKELALITESIGREHGDFHPFWQERNYLDKASNIKAATFIVHGQSDWNVRQRHAIKLWEAIDNAPKRMFLHRGGHSYPSSNRLKQKVNEWFEQYVEGTDRDIRADSTIEVQHQDGSWVIQEQWPSEKTVKSKFFFNKESKLTEDQNLASHQMSIIDSGKTVSVKNLLKSPDQLKSGRVIFTSERLVQKTMISGTPKIKLNLAVINRKAANLTVAVIEYKSNGRGSIITRGWADPQNHSDLAQGELLLPGKFYTIEFELEPKQYIISKGSRIGVMITSTDYEHTIRPAKGTELQFDFNQDSFIEMNLSN